MAIPVTFNVSFFRAVITSPGHFSEPWSDEEIITIRQSNYLNSLIEQDHRNIKRRIRLMLGFKSFRRAQTLLAGIELFHMIRKGQYQPLQSDGLSPAEQFYLLTA